MILGIHVSKTYEILEKKKSRELDQAIRQDLDELGLNACQVYLMGPHGTNPVKINAKAVMEETKDIDVVVHGRYAAVAIWKVFDINKKSPQSIFELSTLATELKLTHSIGAWGYVLHIAKMLPEDIAHTMRIIKPIAVKAGVKILLEMVASKTHPERTYETPERLDNLVTLIDKECKSKDDWYGLCIDTAHIWCAGQEIHTYEQMNDWLERLTFKNKIKLFHVNGCKSARGSGKDKHEIPFCSVDKIWGHVKPEDSGLKAVTQFAVKHKIPMILEVKRGTEKELVNCIQYMKKLGGL